MLMDSISIGCYRIVKITENLKLSASAGVDDVNSKFLKSAKEYSSILLSKIFEHSLELDCLPDD